MRRKGIVFLMVLATCVSLFIWKYHSGIWNALQHPLASLDKIKEMAGLRWPTWTLVLRGVVILLFCFLIEILFVGWRQSALKRIVQFRDKSSQTDTVYWLLGLFNLYGVIIFIISFGAFYFTQVFVNTHFSFHLGTFIGNDTLFYLFVFVLMDFHFYVWHYCMHHFRTLWMAHRFHHSASSFNLITSTRVHFISHGIRSVTSAMVIAFVGTPPEMYPILYFIKEIWALWLHSNVRVPIGWIGDYIIATPQWHKVHHSIAKEHHDTNFGFLFVFWDRIFGTYHAPVAVKELGFEGNPYNKKGVIYDTFHVIKSFYISLIR